ncbi:MAG: hypothetical protein E6J74_32400 [Deltaproteobacteria bacterium]|nr:MAG: hypothetical protein E6J74_32400 [Deltaproteobacteria bacterium]
MSDNRDEKLDRMLRSRRHEPASADLAQRIIFKARQLPQTKTMPLWQSVREMFGEFHLPKPAYVLASALVFGIVIGFSAPQDTGPAADDSGVSVQSFLSADEALL